MDRARVGNAHRQDERFLRDIGVPRGKARGIEAKRYGSNLPGWNACVAARFIGSALGKRHHHAREPEERASENPRNWSQHVAVPYARLRGHVVASGNDDHGFSEEPGEECDRKEPGAAEPEKDEVRVGHHREGAHDVERRATYDLLRRIRRAYGV